MKTNKGIASIGIVLIIIGALVFGGVGYLFFTGAIRPPFEWDLNKRVDPIPQLSQNTNAELKEYKNDQIGIYFTYPSSYGEVSFNVVQREPNNSGPFNILKQYSSGEIDFNNLRYFSATFSNTKDIHFGGGIDCTGCDGGNHFGDSLFRGDQSGYEKFYTDSGEIGLMYRGTMKPGEPCDSLGGCYYQGEFSVTFKVNNDYRGIIFYTKDTPENMALLKSLVIIK